MDELLYGSEKALVRRGEGTKSVTRYLEVFTLDETVYLRIRSRPDDTADELPIVIELPMVTRLRLADALRAPGLRMDNTQRARRPL